MRILLTNDDGIMAEGIYTLAKVLEENYEVIIVAPDVERSAQSHAITIFESMVVKEVKLEGLKSKAYSIAGTPADCVRVGLEALSDGDIDLVFSGINRGANLGMDILYSGTVSAAIEASIYNIPSIAVSTEYVNEEVNFNIGAKYAMEIFEKVKEEFLKTNLVLNINVPYVKKDVAGIKVCKIGEPLYDYYFSGENDNGEKTIQAKGRRDVDFKEDTDRYYLRQRYVTVTPLHYDLTNFKFLKEARSWLNL